MNRWLSIQVWYISYIWYIWYILYGWFYHWFEWWIVMTCHEFSRSHRGHLRSVEQFSNEEESWWRGAAAPHRRQIVFWRGEWYLAPPGTTWHHWSHCSWFTVESHQKNFKELLDMMEGGSWCLRGHEAVLKQTLEVGPWMHFLKHLEGWIGLRG